MKIALALGLGLAVGGIFGGMKLAVPAPRDFAGLAGVAGITVGWMLVRWWM